MKLQHRLQVTHITSGIHHLALRVGCSMTIFTWRHLKKSSSQHAPIWLDLPSAASVSFFTTVTLHRQDHVKGGLVVCKIWTDLGHFCYDMHVSKNHAQINICTHIHLYYTYQSYGTYIYNQSNTIEYIKTQFWIDKTWCTSTSWIHGCEIEHVESLFH